MALRPIVQESGQLKELPTGRLALGSVMVSETVPDAETIPSGYQLQVYGTLELEGKITIEGKLVLL